MPPRSGAIRRTVLAAAWIGLNTTATAAQQLAATPPATRTADSVLAFQGVTVIDVETGRRRPGQTIVVVGNRIRAVGPVGRVRVPAGARVIAGQGKYVIPGLWDMHVHALGDASPYTPFVIYGVTGVRDMATVIPLDTLHRWRREIATGERIGPRVIASGPYLEADSTNPLAAVVTTVSDARRIVDSLRGAGADFIKVHFNMVDFKYSSVTPEVFFAILAEARKVGIPVVGHQAQSVSIADAADSGQRTFEHTLFMHTPCWKSDPAGERACAAEAAHLVRNKAWVTPTLSGLSAGDTVPLRPGWEASYVPESSSSGFHGSTQDGLWLVRRLRSLGIRFLAGSDAAMGTPGNGLFSRWVSTPDMAGRVHRELELLVRAGLTPLEALQAATLNPARLLDATDSLGTISPGKLADLVLLDADPLAHIANTTKIRAVVANGRYFDRAALDRLLDDAERLAKQSRHP